MKQTNGYRFLKPSKTSKTQLKAVNKNTVKPLQITSQPIKPSQSQLRSVQPSKNGIKTAQPLQTT